MMEFIRSRPLVAGIGALVLLFIVFGSFLIVPETKQAVIVRFGKPDRILGSTTAGMVLITSRPHPGCWRDRDRPEESTIVR